MTLASMTGFARVEGAEGDRSWHWELRSVNSRGLDLRMRLPSGFERLEPRIRERAQKHLVRGSLTIAIQLRKAESGGAIRINQSALDTIVRACEELSATTNVAPPRADGLLALKGVLEIDEEVEDAAARTALDKALMVSFDTALVRLVEMRREEGTRLKAVLEQRLVEIEDLTAQADANPARSTEAIGRRLGELVAQLLDAAPALDQQRLHQEAVLLAAKADIREELDRLVAHVAAARELLNGAGAIGRKLDFLTQEFNREANTVCSKSNDVDLTRIGLAIKSAVDQLREQVQNVE